MLWTLLCRTIRYVGTDDVGPYATSVPMVCRTIRYVISMVCVGPYATSVPMVCVASCCGLSSARSTIRHVSVPYAACQYRWCTYDTCQYQWYVAPYATWQYRTPHSLVEYHTVRQYRARA
eukprot:2698901-Rhodomonas_salina.1